VLSGAHMEPSLDAKDNKDDGGGQFGVFGVDFEDDAPPVNKLGEETGSFSLKLRASCIDRDRLKEAPKLGTSGGFHDAY